MHKTEKRRKDYREGRRWFFRRARIERIKWHKTRARVALDEDVREHALITLEALRGNKPLPIMYKP